MYVKYSNAVIRDVDGAPKRFVDCALYADTAPSPLPTAKDLPGYTEEDQIEAGSSLYIVNTGAVYIADESGTFVAQ